jgi:diguanylate cyclase (GGDEF)-like protein
MRAPWLWPLLIFGAIGGIIGLQTLANCWPDDALPHYLWNHAADWLGMLVCGVAVWWGSRVIPVATERWGWRAIALAVLLFGLGDSLWVFYVVAWHTPDPFPSWADLFYTLGYLPLLVGLFLQPILHIRDRYGWVALFLESLIVIFASLSLLWYLSIGPTLLHADSQTPLAKVLTLAYPLLDLVVFVGMLSLIIRGHAAAFTASRLLLLAAVLVMIGADTAFSYLQFHDRYQTATWLDIAWPISYVLFGGAALAQARAYLVKVCPNPDVLAVPSRWHFAVPYVLVGAASAVLLLTFLHHGHSPEEEGLLLGTVIVFFLVIIRQGVTFEENRRLYTELTDAYQAMTQLARTDAVTGLANHRAFRERLAEEGHRAARYQAPAAVIFADLDHFKQINDTFGHQVGDQVLHQVGAVMVQTVRNIDLVARYGGEEFVVLLTQTSLDQAAHLAERLRHAIATLPVTLATGESLAITISLGVSAYPRPSLTLDDLVADADAAMYAAKSAGRNCVRVHGDAALVLSSPAIGEGAH